MIPALGYMTSHLIIEYAPISFPVVGLVFGSLLFFILKRYLSTRQLVAAFIIILCTSWAVAGYYVKVLYMDFHRNPTTQISDKRAFNAVLEKKLKTSKPLSLLMIDVDHFKEVNDTYGHIEGDKVLIELSKLLKNDLRIHDFISHWGGDEFAIILPSTTNREAAIVAERLRNHVHDHSNRLHKVTISVGISSSTNTKDPKEIIRLADKALYEAKKYRDKVVIYPE